MGAYFGNIIFFEVDSLLPKSIFAPYYDTMVNPLRKKWKLLREIWKFYRKKGQKFSIFKNKMKNAILMEKEV